MGFVLATFNVLDMFDASDAARIERIAAILRPHAPNVVALQEVGGAAAVNAIATALGGGFESVIGDADDRGIACALLSKARIVEKNILRAEHLTFPRFHREDPEPFGSRIPLRRTIPDVLVDAPGFGRVRILVVHFKSRRAKPMRDERGNEIAETTTSELAESEARAVAWRSAEALFVRRAVDERLKNDPNEMLCVCGDFNDVPDSLPLRIVAGTAGDSEQPRADALVSSADSIPLAERVSVEHGGAPTAIDHALMSSALAARFSRAFYERSTRPDPRVTSDHAPLIVQFI